MKFPGLLLRHKSERVDSFSGIFDENNAFKNARFVAEKSLCHLSNRGIDAVKKRDVSEQAFNTKKQPFKNELFRGPSDDRHTDNHRDRDRNLRQYDFRRSVELQR